MLKLLFGKIHRASDALTKVDAETCRPYLLTLLTHRASWGRLQSCVDHLLSRYKFYFIFKFLLDSHKNF